MIPAPSSMIPAEVAGKQLKALQQRDIIKAKLCEEPLLQRPDFSQPFILTTDASANSIYFT